MLIGIQFWFANRGGVYVLWYLPFLLLLAFRPNLNERVPVPIRQLVEMSEQSRGVVGGYSAPAGGVS